MKVLKKYDDGSQTILFEPGDKVRLTKRWRDDWIAKQGEVGTVIRYRTGSKPPTSISFLEVQTEKMEAGGWGVITVAPWQVEGVNK